MIIGPYFNHYGDRFWAVYDKDNSLVAVTVYKKGAIEVGKWLKSLNEALVKADEIIEGCLSQMKGATV